MRICYLADVSSVHSQRWIQFFVDRGHEVHVISARPYSGSEVRGLTLHVLKLPQTVRGITSILAVPQVRFRIGKISPHIVHAHNVTGYGFWGALSGFHPFVLTAWGSDVLVDPVRSLVTRMMVRHALKTADLVTCDGHHLADPIKRLGLPVGRLQIVYFGVDTRMFSPAQPRGDMAGSKDGTRKFIVISLRSLYPVYDVETLIRAAPAVIQEVPHTFFRVVGDGDQQQRLEQLASTLGVGSNVRFLGRVPSQELPGYLQSADIYVSTARSDAGLAASTAEAMACGLPVVVTDFGDNRLWMRNGEGGALFPAGDHRALAKAIVRLLKDEAACKQSGDANRKVIEEHNDHEKEMTKMEQLYRELLPANAN